MFKKIIALFIVVLCSSASQNILANTFQVNGTGYLWTTGYQNC